MAKLKTKIPWQGQILDNSKEDDKRVFIKNKKPNPTKSLNLKKEKSNFKGLLQNYTIVKGKRRGHDISIISNFFNPLKDDLKNLYKILKLKLACGGTMSKDSLILQSVDSDKIRKILEELKA